MKFGSAVAGDIKRIAAEAHAGVAAGVRAAVDDAGAQLQDDLRGQVIAAGLGTRLAQTWRRRTYPESGEKTLSPAALVWSKAPTIIRAYAHGTVIRPTDGRAWLAIPTEWVPLKAGRGRGGTARPMSPVEVEARFNRDLRFVPLPGGRAVLIMDQVIVGRKGGLRRATKGRLAQGRKTTGKIMFVLVRQVQVKKRIDIETAAAAAQTALSGRLAGLAGG